MSIIIVKNQTGSSVMLGDIDLEDRNVPASGQRNLTNTNTIAEIQSSIELASEINAGNLILNINGDDRTQQESISALSSPLSISSGIIQPIAITYFNAYLSESQEAFSDSTTVDIDAIRLQSPAGAFSLSNGEIAVESPAGLGVYDIDFWLSVDNGGNSRSKGQWWIELDTGSGFFEVAGTRAGTYHRNSSQGEGSASPGLILQLDTGYKLRIRGDSVKNSSMLPQNAGIKIRRIG